MDNTAKITELDNASIEGLEEVFAEVAPQGPTKSDPQGIPPAEAAEKLGVSERTVLKRLRKGTLKGFKAQSKYGLKWFVLSDQVPEVVHGTTQDGPEEDPQADLSTQDFLIEDLKSRNRELEEKIYSLTFRNGYLESKLEERESTIKLLEDKSNSSWFLRTWRWFIGSS